MKGFTLIDVLIGSFLMLIVFGGIFGAFQIGMKAVFLSRARIEATSIAKGEIEKIRNLSYEDVGIEGSYPDGVLEQETDVSSNRINYRIQRRIDFVIDFLDGIADPEDECPNDYKKTEIKVSWQGKWPGEVRLVTDVMPQNLAQECATLGGVLLVSVFDALGDMILSPLIEVKDPDTDETLKSATPDSGKHYFSLPPNTYKIMISKDGFSSERTYGTDEITTPEKPHPLVLEGEVTEISFSIDKVGSFSVDTFSSWGMDSFSDSFQDDSKTAEFSDVVIDGGEVILARTNGDYKNSGYLVSVDIEPGSLISWDEFSFSDLEPDSTGISYHVLYFNGESWALIPDIDLPDNSEGFGTSPVDLSGLDSAVYSQIRLKANLSTSNPSASPFLYNWQASWKTTEPVFIPDVLFQLQGEKIIGLDEGEEPVYKYSQEHTSNSSGHVDILNLEWDSYTFSVDPDSGLDLTETSPSPQPIDLLPDANLSVSLYLEAENSLLVAVQDSETGEPIFSATVQVENADLGYDKTQYTNQDGQTYFIPLETEDYNLEIEVAGYDVFLGTVSVLEDTVETIELSRIE